MTGGFGVEDLADQLACQSREDQGVDQKPGSSAEPEAARRFGRRAEPVGNFQMPHVALTEKVGAAQRKINWLCRFDAEGFETTHTQNGGTCSSPLRLRWGDASRTVVMVHMSDESPGLEGRVLFADPARSHMANRGWSLGLCLGSEIVFGGVWFIAAWDGSGFILGGVSRGALVA